MRYKPRKIGGAGGKKRGLRYCLSPGIPKKKEVCKNEML